MKPNRLPAEEESAADAVAAGHRRFAATIDGDSMEPVYIHGDTVIFDIDAELIDGKDYFFLFSDGTTTFKRLRVQPDRLRYILRPLNPKYAAREVEKTSIRTIARAVLNLIPEKNFNLHTMGGPQA